MGMVKKSVMNMMNITTKMSIEKIKNNVELAASLNLPVQLAVLVSEEDIIKYSSFGGSSLETLLVVLEYPWIASSLEKLPVGDRNRFVKFIDDHGGCWENLHGLDLTEDIVFEAVFGCEPAQYYNAPWWVRHFSRANPFKGNWVSNFASIYNDNFDNLSDEELRFVVATDGLLPLKFLEEKERILAVVSQSDNWERDACIIAEGGLFSLGCSNIFDGLEEFYPVDLLLKIREENCLGLLPRIKPIADALILQKNFWKNCDFSSFKKLPFYFFRSWDGYVPLRVTYTADNCSELKPLTLTKSVYCTQMHTLEIPAWLPEFLENSEVCNVVFYELEGKRDFFIKQFGKEEASKIMHYNYGWDTVSLEFKDIVLKYELTNPVEESAGEIITSCFKGYTEICAGSFHGDWRFVLELAKSGALDRIRNIYSEIFYKDYAELVAERITAYLNGEQYWTDTSFLLHNADKEEHLDFMTAVEFAEDYQGDEPLSVWFLNLLDGNRVLSEDGERVGIMLNKPDGSIITYFGGEKSGDVIVGITGAPYQIIDIGGEYKSYCGVCAANPGDIILDEIV